MTALHMEPVEAVAAATTHFSNPNSALDSPNDLIELLQTSYEPPSPDHHLNQSLTPFPRLCSAVWSPGSGKLACIALGGFYNLASTAKDIAEDLEQVPSSPPASLASASSVVSSEDSYQSSVRSSTLLGYPATTPRTVSELEPFRKWLLSTITTVQTNSDMYSVDRSKISGHKRSTSHFIAPETVNFEKRQRSKSSLERVSAKDREPYEPLIFPRKVVACCSILDFIAPWGSSEREHLARVYTLNGTPLYKTCLKNAQLAQRRGWSELKQIWETLSYLLVDVELSGFGASCWPQFPSKAFQIDSLLQDLAVAGDVQTVASIVCLVQSLILSKESALAEKQSDITSFGRKTSESDGEEDEAPRLSRFLPPAPPILISEQGATHVLEGNFCRTMVLPSSHNTSAYPSPETSLKSSASSLTFSRSNSTITADLSAGKKPVVSSGRRLSSSEAMMTTLTPATIKVSFFNRADWLFERALFPVGSGRDAKDIAFDIVEKYQYTLITYCEHLAAWKNWLSLAEVSGAVPNNFFPGQTVQRINVPGFARSDALKFVVSVRCLVCGCPLIPEGESTSLAFKCINCSLLSKCLGVKRREVWSKVCYEVNYSELMPPLRWSSYFLKTAAQKPTMEMATAPKMLVFEAEDKNKHGEHIETPFASRSLSEKLNALSKFDKHHAKKHKDFSSVEFSSNSSSSLSNSLHSNEVNSNSDVFPNMTSLVTRKPQEISSYSISLHSHEAAAFPSAQNLDTFSYSSSSLSDSASSDSVPSVHKPGANFAPSISSFKMDRQSSKTESVSSSEFKYLGSLNSSKSAHSIPLSTTSSFKTQLKDWRLWEDAQNSEKSTDSESEPENALSNLFGEKINSFNVIENKAIYNNSRSSSNLSSSREALTKTRNRMRLNDGHLQPLISGTQCIICRLPIRGLLLLCLCCGHGGHVDEINSWFDSDFLDEKIECPVPSCGCLCSLKRSSLL